LRRRAVSQIIVSVFQFLRALDTEQALSKIAGTSVNGKPTSLDKAPSNAPSSAMFEASKRTMHLRPREQDCAMTQSRASFTLTHELPDHSYRWQAQPTPKLFFVDEFTATGNFIA
jgi:hypothetical protein